MNDTKTSAAMILMIPLWCILIQHKIAAFKHLTVGSLLMDLEEYEAISL